MTRVTLFMGLTAATLLLDGCRGPVACNLLPITAITIAVVDSATGRAILDSVEVHAVQTVAPAFDGFVSYPEHGSPTPSRIKIFGGPGVYDLTVQRNGYAPSVQRGVLVSSDDAPCPRPIAVDLTIALSPAR